MNKEIKLGVEAKDKITGFKGIVTARVIYLYGCDQWGLQPPVDKDQKRVSSEFFDVGRLEVIGNGILPEEVQADKPGCETREYPKEENPGR